MILAANVEEVEAAVDGGGRIINGGREAVRAKVEGGVMVGVNEMFQLKNGCRRVYELGDRSCYEDTTTGM
jgi:hypothetical protein